MQYHIIIDSFQYDKKSSTIEDIVNRIHSSIDGKLSESPQNADIIFVLGGDGFLIQTMRSHHEYGGIFYGINIGTLGFLANDKSLAIPHSLQDIATIQCPIIPVKVTDTNGHIYDDFFINDAVVGTDLKNYYSFNLQGVGDTVTIVGSSLIINTPQGCTGYAVSMGQPLLDIHSDLLGIVGCATRGFDYTLIHQQKLTICDSRQRDTLALCLDGKGGSLYSDTQSVTIYPSVRYLSLGFASYQSFVTKRILLAEASHGNVIDTSALK